MKRDFLSLVWSSLLLASPALCGSLAVDSTSVPEPGTLILLGTVAAGIGFAAWRKNRR